MGQELQSERAIIVVIKESKYAMFLKACLQVLFEMSSSMYYTLSKKKYFLVYQRL